MQLLNLPRFLATYKLLLVFPPRARPGGVAAVTASRQGPLLSLKFLLEAWGKLDGSGEKKVTGIFSKLILRNVQLMTKIFQTNQPQERAQREMFQSKQPSCKLLGRA